MIIIGLFLGLLLVAVCGIIDSPNMTSRTAYTKDPKRPRHLYPTRSDCGMTSPRRDL